MLGSTTIGATTKDSPSPTESNRPHSNEARVVEASVRLTVYRGGERHPDGRVVDRQGARVDGVVEYRLAQPARPGQQLILLNFAEAIARDPIELDEVSIATHLSGPFDRGSLVLTGLWGVEHSERVGERRDVVLTLSPGSDVVTLRYTVDVPHRYWPFGCVRRRCSLSAAVAPLPSEPARGGRWLPAGRVITPVVWTVEEAALGTDGDFRPRLRRRVRPSDGIDPPLVRAEELIVLGDDPTPRQFPTVIWGPTWFRSRVVVRGVEIEVLHPRRRPLGRAPNETFVQLRRDVAGQVLEIGTEAVALLQAVDQPLPPGQAITVVSGPLRHSVAQAHPDLVMLSDQAMQLVPFERFAKFHHSAIARAMFDMLMEQRFRGRHDGSVDLWLPGMMGFSLAGLWQRTRDHADEYAADILRNFTFVPAVDRFLYTQQASFSQSYFRGVEDKISLRDHPLWFSHALPTGRRIHEKLRDTAGDKALARFYQELVEHPGHDPRRLAERAYGHTLDWFFDQWLGPYPSVDYLVQRVEHERTEQGWAYRITIRKSGERPVIEPVQVLATERGGQHHYLLWNGEVDESGGDLDREPHEGTHTFHLVTERRLKAVRLDPRSRLLQQPQPPRKNVDPRFNDRSPPSFRFLYTGAGISIAASELLNATTPAARFNAIAGFASFEASLRRDLRRTGHLRVSRDRETNAGLGASVNLWFGDKVNNQRRRSRVRLFASGAWLNQSSLDPVGGVRLIERVSLIDDTRRFGWWPERGGWLSASVAARHTLRTEPGLRDVHDLVTAAAWIRLWRLAHDHVLATAVSGEMVVPLVGRSEFRNLSRLGGIGGLSGYLADEIFGRAALSALAEYRHVYINDLHLNLAHVAYLRSIGGTAFAGTGTVAGCESLRGWFSADSWYGSVGYSVDARLSVFGVTPQLFRVTASVPLVRRDTQCLGQSLPAYLGARQGLTNDEVRQLLPKFNINVIFQQSF